eukprot:298693-Prorocentrum_minimum.AAC.1
MLACLRVSVLACYTMNQAGGTHRDAVEVRREVLHDPARPPVEECLEPLARGPREGRLWEGH